MRLTGRIITEETPIFGHLTVDGSRIGSIETEDSVAEDAPYIMPGFIDLHVHGGGGADIMEGGAAARILAETHARFGTTSVLATTMTAEESDIIRAVEAVAAVMAQSVNGADILGIHLEGPFINENKLGAQPDYVRRADRAFISRLAELAPLRIITLAPEFAENLDIIPWLAERNIRVQIGHTLAKYEQCMCALRAGAQGFTHLYNAMSPLQHRAAGAVGAALAHAVYCEIIPDLVHSDEGALRAAMRAIPRLYGITDGTAACGMPDGCYKLGENIVYSRNGAVRLKDNTLAGSVLTLDRAFRNFIELGDTVTTASRRLSAYQADYLGLHDRGRLEPSLRADIVVMDNNFKVMQTIVAGQCVYNRQGSET